MYRSFQWFLPRLLHAGLAIALAAGLAAAFVYAVRAQAPAPAAPSSQSSLRINEVMADNESTLADPDEPGEAPDWIEIYNPTNAPVSLDGLALSDDEENPTKFPITNGLTIPAFGFILFYADEDQRQGPQHTNFRLSASGEYIGLARIDSPNPPIDGFDFPALQPDQSYGRRPDGSGPPQVLDFATPGAANGGDPPRILAVSAPPAPAPSFAPVTVTASITDIDAIVAATIVYTTSIGGEQNAAMAHAGGDLYVGQIPGQPDGTLVSYFVRAVDEDGESNRLPLPGNEHRYLAGYTPPPLILNEIVYWNLTAPDPDEPAEFPDWIEIYNPTGAAISLNGLSLSDNRDNPLKYQIPNGLSVPANGRIVFLADDDPGQGALHLNFGLQADGEYVGLYGGQGTLVIDSYDLNYRSRTGAAGRIPDGSTAADAWSDTVCPTFNRPNRNCDKAQFLPAVMR